MLKHCNRYRELKQRNICTAAVGTSVSCLYSSGSPYTGFHQRRNGFAQFTKDHLCFAPLICWMLSCHLTARAVCAKHLRSTFKRQLQIHGSRNSLDETVMTVQLRSLRTYYITRRSHYGAYVRLSEDHGRSLIAGINYPIPSRTDFSKHKRLRTAMIRWHPYTRRKRIYEHKLNRLTEKI
jgi:hypothetical protein